MRIPGIINYTDKINNTPEQSNKIDNARKSESAAGMGDQSNRFPVKNLDNIITSGERDFFMDLFPENSDLIENHVLFTSNGRLQHPEISKGKIVDGRI